MRDADFINPIGIRMLPAAAEGNPFNHLLASVIVDQLRDLLLHHNEIIPQGRIAAVKIQDFLADSLRFRMFGIKRTDNILPMPEHPMHEKSLFKSSALGVYPTGDDGFYFFQSWCALCHSITS